MSKVVVLGGGISGLSTAYYLSKFPSNVFQKITLLEGSNRLGGWIQTSRFDDGTIFEHGPRNMRATGKTAANTLKLIEELGLEEDVIAVPNTSMASKNRFILANNQICALPNGIMGVIKRTPPFSKSMVRLAWKEPFKLGTKLHDESVYDFFQRRFAKELADYASDPMCRGIFAGDCRKLSVKSCFAPVFNLEQKYGSLVRGAILMPKDKTVPTGLLKKARNDKWALWSLRQGLVQLPDAMMNILNRDPRVHVITDAHCNRLTFTDNKVKVQYNNQEEDFDHVFSAVQATNLAKMVADDHVEMSTDLNKIPMVTVGVVNLEYENWDFPLQGFGHLIPSFEPSKILGVLYESCVFPDHDRRDGKAVRVTCMMGGAWFKEYFGDPDTCDPDLLGQVAIESVKQQLNVQHQPCRVIVNIQKDCIPQYHLGHCDILERLDTYIDNHNLPISLLGASFRGVSVNDCIDNARIEAEKLAQCCQK